MKALVLADKNQPLVLQELPDPVAGKDEAIIKIHAAALNHRDLWIQKGQYAGLKYPVVPGSDGAGVVTATGDNGHAHWIGKEVVIYPALYWGEASSHQHPEKFRVLGLPDDGTLAEYIRIPVRNLVEKPAYLSFEEAATLPVAGLTAYRALFVRAHIQPREKILITGIGGGVALFALQFALAAGAEVYVSSGSEEKIERAIALGAKGGVNYKQENWVSSLKQQAGSFDIILDGAAGDGFNDLLDLCAPGKRVVLYGATKGVANNIAMRRLFWKQLNVLGSTMGSEEDFVAMIAFMNQHRIKPIIDKIFPFTEGEAALRRMDETQQFGKIVIKTS